MLSTRQFRRLTQSALMIGFGAAASAAAAQDVTTLGRHMGRPSASQTDVAVAGRPANHNGTEKRKGTVQKYFIEFRARTALSYGHAFVVHGPVTRDNKISPDQIAGLHPRGTSSAVYILGHLIPVPAETGASEGDTDEKYVTARYRIEMGKAEYLRVAAFIKHLQANSPTWNATSYNCNAFVADIAQFMGLQTPSPREYPKDFINKLRLMNSRL